MAARHGLVAFRRSLGGAGEGSVLVLDTLGELASVYALCDVAFVGGSLVPQRGHNPLEPAVYGKPVLFGPCMEDFAEISRDLLAVGGARQVRDAEELRAGLSLLLTEPAERERAGRQARELIASRRGVTEAHIALIRRVLAREEKG
jgi:3-deoxy-D-manno-octulosonic-acid transferase